MTKQTWRWMDDNEVELFIRAFMEQMCKLSYGEETIGKFLALSIKALVWANTNLKEVKNG